MIPSLSLLSCELSVSVKENSDRKKNATCKHQPATFADLWLFKKFLSNRRLSMRQSAFCLPLHLTSVHFRGELQYLGHVDGQKIKCQPIRNREIGGVKLQDELYDSVKR